MPVELLSIAETAEHLGLHPKTVERMIRRGELPAIRIGDRKGIRVRADDLQEFIDAHADGVPASQRPGTPSARHNGQASP